MYSEEEIINQLKDLEKRKGKVTENKIVEDVYTATPETIKRVLNVQSLEGARRKANLKKVRIKRGRKKEITKKKAIKELQRLYCQEGNTKFETIKNKCKYSYNSVKTALDVDTLIKARKIAGVKKEKEW